MAGLINFFYRGLQSPRTLLTTSSITDGYTLQKSEKIDEKNIIKYGIDNQIPVTPNIPACNFNGQLWIKTSIPASDSVTFKFKIDNSKPLNIDNVFLMADDFSASYVNTNKWIKRNSSTITNGYLKLYSDGGLKSKISVTYKKFLIEGRGYISTTGSGSFCRLALNDSAAFRSDPSSYCWDILFWSNGNFFIEYGGEKVKSSYTANTNYIHRMSVDRDTNKIIYYYGSGSDTVNTTIPSDPYVYLYVTGAELYIDYILVRKKESQDPSVSINQTDNDEWEVTIHNPNQVELNDYQIQIPVPVNNYDISIKSYPPTFTVDALPNDVVSYISYKTILDRGIKLNSDLLLAIHSFIPQSATPGIIDVDISFMGLNTDLMLVGGSTVNISTSDINIITNNYQLEITEEMIGKHIVFTFSNLEVFDSIDKIVLCRIKRNGDNEQDTFGYALPILDINWITQQNALGSKTIISKN